VLSLYRTCALITRALSLVDLQPPTTSLSQLKRSGGFSRGVVAVAKPSSPPPPQPPPSLQPRSVHVQSSSSMNIDMALATSYKPVLVCIVKVGLLMIFHYTSASFLFITERYALIVATLYIDQWIQYEYIVNTNSCLAIIAGSLLIHELRDAGIPERIHGPIAHTILLSLLVSVNVLVLMFGEHHSCHTTQHTQSPAIDDETQKKTRQPIVSAHNQSQTTVGAFVCVLCNTVLLVLLCTCAIPPSTHDPLLNNLRVWSFMTLSLVWTFTVNFKDLRYSTVANVTPCVLRFSCILFITPLPLAIGGVFLMGACLATIHALLHRRHKESLLPCVYSADHVHNHAISADKAVVVSRDSQPGSVISYRTPVALSESCALSKTLNPSNTTLSSPATFAGPCNSLISPANASPTAVAGGNHHAAFGSESIGDDPHNTESCTAPVDYTALFQQVLSEHKL
jgi:hypothetical protein